VEGIPNFQDGVQLWAVSSKERNIGVAWKPSIFIDQLDGYKLFKNDSTYSAA